MTDTKTAVKAGITVLEGIKAQGCFISTSACFHRAGVTAGGCCR